MHRRVFYAASAAGGGADPKAAEPQATVEPAATEPKPSETDELKVQLEAANKEKEALQQQIEADRIARMTAEEKKSAQEKALHDSSVKKLKVLNAKAYGIGEENADLIGGDTPDEIEASAKAIGALLQKQKAETETSVKKELSRTPAPGASASNNEAAIDPVDFYRGIIEEQKGRKG